MLGGHSRGREHLALAPLSSGVLLGLGWVLMMPLACLSDSVKMTVVASFFLALFLLHFF